MKSGLELDLSNRRQRPVTYNLDPDYAYDRPDRPSAAIEDGAAERLKHKFAMCSIISVGIAFITAQFTPSLVAVAVLSVTSFLLCWESMEVS